MDTPSTEITRRHVLQATGGALAVGTFGVWPTAAQEGCQGSALESTPDDLPEVSLRGEEPAASNIPEGDELLVYIHGYNTSPELGRRLAATLDTAMSDDTPPVVAAPWRSNHEGAGDEAGGGEAFATAEQNADEDGQKLAAWLEANAADRTVRLVGYSLGTRVTLTAIDALDGETVDLASVSLLGSAVPAELICGDGGYDLSAARAVFSYRSENDQVLCDTFITYLTFVSEANPPAIGCAGPDCGTTPENFVDRDVSETIDNHCAYGFADVGVVPEMEEDFTRPLSEVERDEGQDQETETPTPTDEPEDQETPTETPTVAETETPVPETDTETETDDGDGPGFGVGTAIASLGGVGYILKRRLGGER